MSDVVFDDADVGLNIEDENTLARLPCPAMPVDLFGTLPMSVDLLSTLPMLFELPNGLPTPLDLFEMLPMPVELLGTLPMVVDLCGAPVSIQVLTHDGVVVTHDGEPVYIVAED